MVAAQTSVCWPQASWAVFGTSDGGHGREHCALPHPPETAYEYGHGRAAVSSASGPGCAAQGVCVHGHGTRHAHAGKKCAAVAVAPPWHIFA